MNPVPVEMEGWSRRRWGIAIALVLVVQAALVFLLEDRTPDARRKATIAPQIHLRKNISLAALAVSDPTLFVLPHREGFSGEAWLNHLPAQEFRPPDWTDPQPRWLALAPDKLGENFKDFIAANAGPPFQTIAPLEPERGAPTLFPVETPPAQSTLRIEGGLAKRRLLAPLPLPSWPSAELVTNSVVQLGINASGNTFSTVLLSSSGDKAADDRALELAKAAQFEPLPAPDGTDHLTLGTLTFEWQTLSLPATNAPPEIP